MSLRKSVVDAFSGDGADSLIGDRRANLLASGRGEDRIEGAAGDDQLSAGRGNDKLNGGDGADVLARRRRGRPHRRPRIRRFSFVLDRRTDRIEDFDAQHDTIELRCTPGFDFNDLVFQDIPPRQVQVSYLSDHLIVSGSGKRLASADFSHEDFMLPPDPGEPRSQRVAAASEKPEVPASARCQQGRLPDLPLPASPFFEDDASARGVLPGTTLRAVGGTTFKGHVSGALEGPLVVPLEQNGNDEAGDGGIGPASSRG